MTTFERVREVVAESLGVDAAEIAPESSFRADLGADSMDIAQLILDLEEAFDVDVSNEDAQRLNTMQEVVDFVDRCPQ